MLSDGREFAQKALINVFGAGDSISQWWGGVATDGTMAVGIRDPLVRWFSGPNNKDIASGGVTYDTGMFLVTADGELYLKQQIEDSSLGMTLVDTDVISAGCAGSVVRMIVYIKKDQTLNVTATVNLTGIPSSLGIGTTINQFESKQIPIALPNGEEPKKAIATAGTNYVVHGYTVLSTEGKLYHFGCDKLDHEFGGTAAAPIDITPPGVTFKKLGCGPASYGGSHGFLAVSTDGKVYGYSSTTSGLIRRGDLQNPVQLQIDDGRDYTGITMTYHKGSGAHTIAETETEILYANQSDSSWTVKATIPELNRGKDYLAQFTTNSGYSIELADPTITKGLYIYPTGSTD